jgi:hypothetical protein
MQKAWPISVVAVVKIMSQFSCEIAAVEGGRVKKRVGMNNAAMGFFNCNSFYPLKCLHNCKLVRLWICGSNCFFFSWSKKTDHVILWSVATGGRSDVFLSSRWANCLWATGNNTSVASKRGKSIDTTMTESETSDAGFTREVWWWWSKACANPSLELNSRCYRRHQRE